MGLFVPLWLTDRAHERRIRTLAEITPTASQLLRNDIASERLRKDEQVLSDRADDAALKEARDDTVRVVRERLDIVRTEDIRARREAAVRDAELANSLRPNVDLSADAIFDPDLPRGSIIDIVV